MLSIQGLYDGKQIMPLEEIKAKPNVKVIITFLEEEPELSVMSEQPGETILTEKNGIWVAKGKISGNQTDITRQERDRRVAEQLHRMSV